MSLDDLAFDRAGLLVIDMQNAFCHPEGTLGVSGVPVETARSAIAPIERLVTRFQALGRPVVWTQQVHLERDASRARKQLPSHTDKRKQVSALSGSWDAAFIDELAHLVVDPTMVVVKHRFGAFYQTRLESLLRMLGVQALFVTGTTANACVETTLREAYLRDYDVVAVTDAIGTVRTQWLDVAHAVWAQYLGHLATSDEVMAWLEAASGPRAEQVHHLLLECQDLDASVRFYTEVLGLRVRARDTHRDGRPLVLTTNGLGLTEGGTDAGGTVEHLAFRSRGVDALAARAEHGGRTDRPGTRTGPVRPHGLRRGPRRQRDRTVRVTRLARGRDRRASRKWRRARHADHRLSGQSRGTADAA
jgi:ureidoacrylate peracid hydrolase